MAKSSREILRYLRRNWYWFILGILVFLGLSTYLYYIHITVGFVQWSGFRDKTLWDVIELVGIPLVLTVGGYLFNREERKAERRIANERSRETALQSYLDHMTELVIEKGISRSTSGSDVRLIARMRTLTVLEQLDGLRKGIVLRFLFEGKLINRGKPIVKLNQANFTDLILNNSLFPRIDLRHTHLTRSKLLFVDLSDSELSNANLAEAYIVKADLRRASLKGADLAGAKLIGTDLRDSDVRGTRFRGIDTHALTIGEAVRGRVNAEFTNVNLSGAKYDEETIWPDGFDPKKYGAVLVELSRHSR